MYVGKPHSHNADNEKTHPPKPKEPKDWEHYELWKKIKEVLENLPNIFESNLNITSAVNVTEIYAFGTVLSNVIEEEVVRSLNKAKREWDPENKYCDYTFIRQPQAFPDVLLKNTNTDDILMGIELKSWYLLAKEGEPSFRYRVTSSACTDRDLLVVVPWVLSNVVTGTPIVFKPFVISAKYAAEYRNYWWMYERKARGDREIRSPSSVTPYPPSRDVIDDEPTVDSGHNFGRLARTGIMDDWVENCKKEKVLGIEVKRWIEFFKKASESSTTCLQ